MSPPPILLFRSNSNFSDATIPNGGVLVSYHKSHLSYTWHNEARFLPLPDPKCPLKVASPAAADAWVQVAKTLHASFGSHAVVVMDFDHPLSGLCLLLKLEHGIEYVLRMDNLRTKMRWQLLPLFHNTLGLLLASDDARNYIIDGFPIAVSTILESQDIQQDINALRSHKLHYTSLCPPPHFETSNAKPPRINVLIVAYVSGQLGFTGAHRANYWFEELDVCSKGRTETHLATAIPHTLASPRLHHIPDFSNWYTLLRSSWSEPAKAAYIATEMQLSTKSNMIGYYWRQALEDCFSQSDLHFDVVILTGSPFSYFDFATFAKRTWRARVILDYRDPFSAIPLIKLDDETKMLLEYLEKGYNYQADALTSVNEFCRKLLVRPASTPSFVIPNGYDERVATTCHTETRGTHGVSLVHCGRMTSYRDPEPLIRACAAMRTPLLQIGGPGVMSPDIVNTPFFTCLGQIPHAEAIARSATASLGVILLSGKGYETTNKAYDYLGLGLDLLVLSPDGAHEGALWDMVKDLDNVYWLRNDQETIMEFLGSYTPGPPRSQDVRQFSRRASTELLLEHIIRLAQE